MKLSELLDARRFWANAKYLNIGPLTFEKVTPATDCLMHPCPTCGGDMVEYWREDGSVVNCDECGCQPVDPLQPRICHHCVATCTKLDMLDSKIFSPCRHCIHGKYAPGKYKRNNLRFRHSTEYMCSLPFRSTLNRDTLCQFFAHRDWQKILQGKSNGVPEVEN